MRNETILWPGRNCWRIERAPRAACLVDGERYFETARAALLRAQHSVLLLGWDLAEEARLVPGESDPDWPNEIGAFLRALVDRREGLTVRILLWDKAEALALGRGRAPGAQALRMNRDRLHYRLDYNHPAFASHHQKVLVIDDAVAFCGGFDFAANRWDTRGHKSDDPRRRLPTGAPYEAHHDVMLAVDGAPARALGALARERWRQATGEEPEVPPAGLEAWPEGLVPDFRDVPVAIARTRPAWRGRREIREAEALYLDAIAAARDMIYMESQYFASQRIGRALAARLGEADGPEIVVVNPKRAPSWLEQIAMDNARTRIFRRLRQADRHSRFRLYAATNDGCEIAVHSKVMVVDDRLFRVGSSNLNNRSMGLDIECDLAVAAEGPGAERIGAGILRLRNDLLAEHLGVSEARLAQAVAEHGSVIRAIEALSGVSERRLVPFPPPGRPRLVRFEHNALTDPSRPIGQALGLPMRRSWAWGLALGAVGLAAGIALRRLAGSRV